MSSSKREQKGDLKFSNLTKNSAQFIILLWGLHFTDKIEKFAHHILFRIHNAIYLTYVALIHISQRGRLMVKKGLSCTQNVFYKSDEIFPTNL